MEHPIVIIGAGMAGLSCARTLAEAGAKSLVFERSHGPGGRAATRSLDNQRFDFGVLFVSSSKTDFSEWLAQRVGNHLLPGWPELIDGQPAPCQPGSLDRHQRRFAVRGGINQVASAEVEHLSGSGVTFHWNSEAVALTPDPKGISVRFLDGSSVVAGVLVLALASPQSQTLLNTLGGHPTARAMSSVMELFPVLPCLTVAALYPEGVESPGWDVSYPGDSPVILLAANQGKLHSPGRRTLVVWQARPAWSGRYLQDEKSGWSSTLLEEAGRLYGPWARAPQAFHSHRWKYSRLDGTGTAGQPLLMPLGGGWLGLAGELFSRESGVEGAWRSGQLLALQILAAERTVGAEPRG